MDYLIIMLLSFATGFMYADKSIETIVVEKECKAPLAALTETGRPQPPDGRINCLDMYEILPIYSDAIKACNMDKNSAIKALEESGAANTEIKEK